MTKKGFDCAVGHDLARGRKVARERFEYHVREALLAGAVGVVDAHTLLLPHFNNRPMAEGPEHLPQPRIQYFRPRGPRRYDSQQG